MDGYDENNYLRGRSPPSGVSPVPLSWSLDPRLLGAAEGDRLELCTPA